MEHLVRELGAHRLVLPPLLPSSTQITVAADPLLAEADVALGQPNPQQAIELERLRWLHITSAGYTRYDTSDLREALQRRAGQLTNSSSVYEEPCAEHLLAMMLALARRLPQMLTEQQTLRSWRQAEYRRQSRLLTGQTVLLYGYGSIARRLTEMLRPLEMTLIGVRRRPSSDEAIRVVRPEEADRLLAEADHVINILPSGPGADRFFDVDRFVRMKAGVIFYNIGRGTTVDQSALVAALQSGRVGAAYLDVTDPEPLPPDHPLWTAPHCYITPHTAGGHTTEFQRLADHFLENLRRYERGEPLRDRVM